MIYLITYLLAGWWQVLNLIHTPLAVITKAAAILPDDVFIDMMPVAWELLIETDQELAAAAGIANHLSFLSFNFILLFICSYLGCPTIVGRLSEPYHLPMSSCHQNTVKCWDIGW